jgi:hypothetical protein
MVRAANLYLEANHLRVNFTPFTRERTTKTVQIPQGMTFAILVKVFRWRRHFRTIPVGKIGNKTGIKPADRTFDPDGGKGWGHSPAFAEDPVEQVPQQATNAFH